MNPIRDSRGVAEPRGINTLDSLTPPDRPQESQSVSSGVSNLFRVSTSVDVDLRAFHTDPHMGEGRHEHVWNVRVYWDASGPFRDARRFRAALEQWLSPYQGNDLPPQWWAAEDLARAVLTLGTGDPIGCVVTRPGYRAEAWRA